MAESATHDDAAALDGEEQVLVAGRNSTKDLIYHLPDPENPTQPRCHIARQVDRPWRSRDVETVVYRRCCKSCKRAKKDST